MNVNGTSNQDDPLIRAKDHFNVKGKPPLIQPKPKPTSKRLQVQATSQSPSSSPIRLPQSKYQTVVNGKKNDDSDSDEPENPGDIVLNSNSLARFAQVDLDAVKRNELLDTSAQRQKVYLGYGKGLQSRRLPSHLVSKVGDDYYEKRKSYDPKVLLDSNPIDQRERTRSNVDPSTGTQPIMSPEDRQKEIMMKMGVPQGTALAGLASIFRKGSAKKVTRSASSSSRDRDMPPLVKAKPKKKSSDTSSPDLSHLKAESPSLRSSFKLFKKKKGRLSRDNSTDDVSRGSFEDLRSETSSISSLSRISIREEDAFEGNFPTQKEVNSPIRPLRESTSRNKPNEDKIIDSPKPTITSTPLKPTPTDTSLLPTSPTNKDRSDSLFKDMSGLFSEKDDLFNNSELDNLFAKTKSTFVANEQTNEKELPKKPSIPAAKNPTTPKKPLSSEKPKIHVDPLPDRQIPSKPMRKTRSRVLDTSIYDKAAENAIKSTKERKLGREKEKDLEKKKEKEKTTPKMALFEEVVEDDDLFGKKTNEKKEETNKNDKVIVKDDLFGELDHPVNQPPSKKELPKNSTLSDDLFSNDWNKTDKHVKPVIETSIEKKSSLFDDLDEETETKKNKTDVMVSLFGDDNEKFTSKLSIRDERKMADKKPELSKEGEKPLLSKKSKIEIESEERNQKEQKPKNNNVFEASLDSNSNTLNAKPSPITKKPTSPIHKQGPPTPVKTKPPVISAKPKRASKISDDGLKNELQKEVVIKNDAIDESEVNKQQKMEEEKEKKKKIEEEREKIRIEEEKKKKIEEEREKIKIEEDRKRKIEEEREKMKIEEERKREKKLEEDKMKMEEDKIKIEEKKKLEEEREKIEEEREKIKMEEERKKMEEEKEKIKMEEEKERKKMEEEREKITMEEESKKMEEEREKLKMEEEKERKKMEEEREKIKMEEESKKMEEEREKLKMEEEKDRKKIEEEREKKKLEEEREKKKLDEEREKKKIEEDKKEIEKKDKLKQQSMTEDKKASDKAVPEWKRKLEEKRLQREKEEKESKEYIEERRKKREALKTPDKDETTPTSVTTKPSLIKVKPKPAPITTGVVVTLSSTKSKESSPISPKSDSTSSTPKEMSPSPALDPSLPKWKQDLIARKKTSGPESPRRSTVSVTVEKKDSELPAWKRELLAKKKQGGEGSSGGTSSRTSTISSVTSSPKAGRRGKEEQPVPGFLKEFQTKKKSTT